MAYVSFVGLPKLVVDSTELGIKICEHSFFLAGFSSRSLGGCSLEGGSPNL